MKNFQRLFVPIVLLLFLNLLNAQVRIIFDTDFGGDADDLGALVILHNLMEQGECELTGIAVWSTEQYVIPAIDAINRYYGHPAIPIGVRKGGVYRDTNNYSKPIADIFEHKLTYEHAMDAVAMYRKLLSESNDQSIVVVAVGPLKNIKDLLESEGDGYSPLPGYLLVEQKVKEFVIMGGNFPQGEWEWNFSGNMPGVTKYVLENLKVPITFSGFELGVRIKTGAVFNQIDPDTPLYTGFMHFSNHAPWIKDQFNGKILDNSTFDQTAVLYAVRPMAKEYWEKVTDGFCQANESGGNYWVKGEKSHHSYLKLIMDPEEMANLIESIMLNHF